MILKRIFDFVFALGGILVLSPVFCVISAAILLDSKGSLFYRQIRVGRKERDFILYKFRTMQMEADKAGLLTVGMNDSRITRVGGFLRRYKLDELPQLINVLNGTMSIVGPRPEVRKYVKLYDCTQRKVLGLKPGLTDYASLAYINENELLARSLKPEDTYIEEIMPAKLELSLRYLNERSFFVDLKIVFMTVLKIFAQRKLE